MKPMSNIAWMTTEPGCPRLAITPGEPAGIGPDVVIKAVQQSFSAELVAIADPTMLEQRAAILGLPLELIEFDAHQSASPHQPGTLTFLPAKMATTCMPGILNAANVQYVLDTVKMACIGCLQNSFDAMVTAPVHKAIINQAAYTFSGHTEFLAEICGTGFPVMMLANPDLRVALVTTHLPLAKVSAAITPAILEKVLGVVWHDLRTRFDIKDPSMLVCGLNPHAGEDSHLGHEESTIIIPVLEKLRRDGMNLNGPLPADTAFTPNQIKNTDVIICMYHDQGLPVIKAQGFGKSVNITLGLP
ncbi:MAG: 4-hydroxythreonine-4-phosphate dehydrogenase PdxA, partial [Gammaproteobacteria bacterium]